MTNPGTYDATLVVLSVLIAMVASYTALDLAARMRATIRWARSVWLATAAMTMGGGIWSMHFIAMLAFSLPGMEMSYDITLTLISLALPIAVTALGFLVAGRARSSLLALTASGFVMGSGIAAMHYTGMAAMRMPVDLHYNPFWVVISLVIAIGAATVAIWLASKNVGFSQRLAAAMVMGLAVSGMHYAAMQGIIFTSHDLHQAHTEVSLPRFSLAAWVTGTTFLILLLAIVAAMFDRRVAERAEREALALRDSEDRLRLLLRSLTDCAIYMLDAEGHVANWYEGAERLKGYTEQEIIGEHFACFYSREDQMRGLPDEALRIAARDGKFEDDGWRFRKDGSCFWASAVIQSVRDQDGEVIGFAKVTRDITERKQSQEALEQARTALFQSQKMEALGQLTGGLAHDFNNLLQAISGSLTLARSRLEQNQQELVERHLTRAGETVDRAAALTRRLLAFASRQILLPKIVQPDALIDHAIDMIRSTIGRRIAIKWQGTGAWDVSCDPNQLEATLLNLAINARDAMPEGGWLTIQANNVHLTDTTVRSQAVPPGDYVEIVVADTGLGMTDETKARAFEPFFTTKPPGTGSGLGLSQVYGFVKQSGGFVLLDSGPTRGTGVRLYLPRAL